MLYSSARAQGVTENQRTYVDATGDQHTLVYREINHGVGPNTFEVIHDGRPFPRLDQGLYSQLVNHSDEQLAHYFAN